MSFGLYCTGYCTVFSPDFIQHLMTEHPIHSRILLTLFQVPDPFIQRLLVPDPQGPCDHLANPSRNLVFTSQNYRTAEMLLNGKLCRCGIHFLGLELSPRLSTYEIRLDMAKTQTCYRTSYVIRIGTNCSIGR